MPTNRLDGSQLFKIFAPTLKASRDGATGQMRIEGIASSTIRDHHGDTITLKALNKMAASAPGMTIFMNHEYRLQDIFGTVEKALVAEGGRDEKTGQKIFDLRLGITVAKSNPEAVKAFELIESDKVSLGLSIGAMIPDGGAEYDKKAGGRLVIDDVDLVETSVVSIPANPRSFVDYAVKALVGLYPDNSRYEALRKNMFETATDTEAVDTISGDEPKESEGTGEVMEGLEVKEGEIASLTVDEDGTGEAHIVDPESAEGQEFLDKTRVTVWDGDKTVEIDTGRTKSKGDSTQSAQADGTENAGGAAETTSTETTKSADTDEIEDAEMSALAIKAASTSLEGSRQMARVLHAQLMGARAKLVEVTEERDAAIQIAKTAMDGTRELVTKIGDLPAGRKTGGPFTEVRKDFESLEGIYDNEMRKAFKADKKG